jgi:hypothetical protein
MINNVHLYDINNDNNITQFTELLNQNNRYILDINNTNGFNIFEKYVYEIALFHLNNINKVLDLNKNIIEFSLLKNNNYIIDYNRETKTYPLVTALTFLNDGPANLLFTNVDIESYKYKNIKDHNNIAIIPQKKNKNVCFDSSNFYGIFNMDNSAVLKINVWSENPNFIFSNYDFNTISKDIAYLNVEFNKDTTCVIESIIDDDKKIIENILYEESCDVYNDLLITINNNKDKGILFIIIKLAINDYYYLINKYGDSMGTDIFNIITKDCIVNEKNIFYKKQIIKNTLSHDVCYWIINESLRHKHENSWKNNKYNTFDKTLDIEEIPSVFNFLKFVSLNYCKQIKTLYNVDNFELNIISMFITKSFNASDNKENDFTLKNDKSFLTLLIQLNNENDFENGKIYFDDDSSLLLMQGDMLIYNGKTMRTKEQVTNGEKVMLVIIIDLE